MHLNGRKDREMRLRLCMRDVGAPQVEVIPEGVLQATPYDEEAKGVTWTVRFTQGAVDLIVHG